MEAKVESINAISAQPVTSKPRADSQRASSPSTRSLNSNAEKPSRAKSPSAQSIDDRPSLRPEPPVPANNTKASRRAPSFLRDNKPSTSALRSLYQNDQNPSILSLDRDGSPQRPADPDSFTLNSPRLSVLSESSFVSVYGKSPKLSNGPSQEVVVPRTRTSTEETVKGPINGVSTGSTNRHQTLRNRQQLHQPRSSPTSRSTHRSEKSFSSRLDEIAEQQRRDNSSTRSQNVSKWLEESVSGDESSPLRHRSGRRRSPRPKRSSTAVPANDHFSSISEVLHKPQPHERSRDKPLPTLMKPMYTGPEVLPPTPDTMSTAQKANSSTQSIIIEKSLNDAGRPPRHVSTRPATDTVRRHPVDTLGLEFENDFKSEEELQ